MKGRLVYTLIISLVSLIIIGALLSIFLINSITSKRYKDFVLRSDTARAQEIAFVISEYYIVNKNLNDIEKILNHPILRLPMMQGMERMGSKHMKNPRLPHGNPNPQYFIENQILVINTNKIIIFDSLSNDKNKKLNKKLNSKGVPVIYNNEPIAHVYVGTMINQGLRITEKDFLNKINISVLVSSLIVSLIGITIGIILFSHLVSPIKKLSIASKKISGGDFSVRIRNTRKDELGILTKNFNEMTESLEESDTWKKRIIADSAHELRTPVSLIQGQLEMMIENIYPRSDEKLKSIYEETQKLTKLINELHELYSADKNQIKHTKEKEDIILLLNSTIQLFDHKLKEKNLTLINESEKKSVICFIDNTKMKQVFSNIISNAIMYTPKQGTISINTKTIKDQAIIEISDSGPGIPEHYRKKVFERFFRIDKSRNRNKGGAGLGLSICKEIVKLHNGEIKIEESPFNGTKMIVEIPIFKNSSLKA